MKRTLEIIATTLLMLSIALSARAVPLQNLFSGASLTAGDKLFDFWVLELIDASSPTLLPNLSAIDVLPVTDGGNDPGPGLQFQLNNEFTLAPNSAPNAFIDLAFSYRASSLGTALIKDNSLEMTLASVTLAGDNGSLIDEFVGTAPGLIDLATEQVEFSFLDGAGLTQTVLDKADLPPRSEGRRASADSSSRPCSASSSAFLRSRSQRLRRWPWSRWV